MSGNARFESTSSIQDELAFGGNYANGQRMSHANICLDRPGSSRDGGENRMFGLGSSSSRGNTSSTGDLPPLSQLLSLDPINLAEHKYSRSEELKRVLEMSHGSNIEDCSIGSARLKPLAMDELKRFRGSLVETLFKARGRTKRFDESMHKLNKYSESIQKKQARNEISANERPGGPNMKKGGQAHRNSPDVVNQRLEDRAKNIVLNKRVRTSVAELRAEGRTNNIIRQPPPLARDRDLLRDGGEGSDLVEEKIRKLPAGESWDRKMKRKRSVGTVLSRPLDGDGELKRVVLHKIGNEPGLQSSDSQSVRSGSSSGISGINKSDGSSLPASSNVRMVGKGDPDKPTLFRDPSGGQVKERLLGKGNNKLNIREENHVASPYSLAKGKGSRAPRSGSATVGSSSPNPSRMSGSLDGWEHLAGANKFHSVNGASNRKRHMPSGSSSPPMTQWVVQRPQKMSRTRRSNLLSPVSSQDDVQLASEGCSSDFGGRMTSPATSGSLFARSMSFGSQQVRLKQEVVSSPARLSESEESGAGDNQDSRLKEKGPGSGEPDERMLVVGSQNNGSNIFLSAKNKVVDKDDIGDCVRRQGRSGRGSSFPRATVSPAREKLETPTSTKPLKNARSGSEKNGSKSGRPPLKKISDRKAFTRVSQSSAVGSPDCTGESDDDREELLEAANYACNPSDVCCSSAFWRKMEVFFAPISLENESFLKQQISLDKNDESFSQTLDQENTNLGVFVPPEDFLSQALGSAGKSRCLSQNAPGNTEMVDEAEDFVTSSGKLESERRKIVLPLYQRVLSALIVEDEMGEFLESRGTHTSSQYGGDELSGVMLPSIDTVPENSATELEPELEIRAQQFSGGRFSCNGSTLFNKRSRCDNQSLNADVFHGDHGFLQLNNGYFPKFSINGVEEPLGMHMKESYVTAIDCPYDQMSIEDRLLLELQSIGLYPEGVPDLADREDETISQEILELEKKVNRQRIKTKIQRNKLLKAVEEEKKIEGCRERVAMDRLVQLACIKQLATRGSSAAKLGIPKVSKQVASAFLKRTLARCRRFEETGKSCFSDPALRDAILTQPSNGINGDMMNGSCPGEAYHHGLQINRGGRGLLHSSDQDFTRTGPVANRGKKKEVLLDDVGSACIRVASMMGSNSLGGIKGKRSERERDKDMSARLCVTKTGRSSAGDFRTERKTKTKPKQKTAQLSPAGNRIVGKLTDAIYSDNPTARVSNEVDRANTKKEFTVVLPHNNAAEDSSKEISDCADFTNLQLHDLDSIELGVANELGGHQDLDSWLNIDEDGIPDHDAIGLDIPMDDLSELNMLL